ncbi:MAG: hypothetical protein J6U23_07915 [Clostridiales bacterium]|nr:hypothetical protein [Clostridiales bacterium]
MKNKLRLLVVSLLSVLMIFSIASCKEEPATPFFDNSNEPTFEELSQKVEVFEKVYGNYWDNHQDELRVLNGEGYTPLGNTCAYTYVANIDGINKADTIRSCTLFVTDDSGDEHVDEYFAVDKSTLFIARTTVPPDGSLGDVTKYFYVGNKLYKANENDSTLEQIDKADTLDLYLSFSDLSELYGK